MERSLRIKSKLELWMPLENVLFVFNDVVLGSQSDDSLELTSWSGEEIESIRETHYERGKD